MQLSVFEAVNAITGDYVPYFGTLAGPADASPDAAAYRTLISLLGSAAALNPARAASLAVITDGLAKDLVICHGVAFQGKAKGA